MSDPTPGGPMTCAADRYTEISARHKLARHRARGDDDLRAFFHVGCYWHVFSGSEFDAFLASQEATDD